MATTTVLPIRGVPIEVGASATVTDSLVLDKGHFDVRNTSSAKVGITVAKALDLMNSTGKQHSYFDDKCDCSFFKSTFEEKTNCKANEIITPNNNTIGFSAGFFLTFGVEVGFSFDLKAWGDELISIYHDSFSFKGYY